MQLTQITPFVPCTDLQQQIAFYTQTLDFAVGFEADNYAFLRWDYVAIRLVEVYRTVDLHDPARENSFYIDVSGIDELYESLQLSLSKLPRGRVRAPFDQDYGQREFHVMDEDCTLILFGEAIESVPVSKIR